VQIAENKRLSLQFGPERKNHFMEKWWGVIKLTLVFRRFLLESRASPL